LSNNTSTGLHKERYCRIDVTSELKRMQKLPTKHNVIGELRLQTKPLETHTTVQNRFPRCFRPHFHSTKS